MDALVEKYVPEPAHSPEPELDSTNSPRDEIAAPITVYSRQETDKTYKGVIARPAKGTYVSSTAPPISSGSFSASRADSGATIRFTARVCP
jgi:hypothetical protein